MTFTKAYARIAAGMLSEDAARILKCFADRGNESDISVEAVEELKDLDFITETTNLIDNSKVWVLTTNGKKVAKELEVE